MNTQVITALDAQIIDAAERFNQHVRASADLTLSAANTRRELGLLLITRKEQTKHGEWVKLFASAFGGKHGGDSIFDFDHSLACRWMRMAVAHPAPFETASEVIGFAKEMGQDVGLIALPEGHSSQRDHNTTIFTAITEVAGKFQSLWTKFRGDELDPATISPQGADAMLAQIAPMADRITKFRDALKARAEA